MAEESKFKLANQGSQVDYFPMEKTPNSLELVDQSAIQVLKIETVVSQAPAVGSRPAAIQTNINKDIESHLWKIKSTTNYFSLKQIQSLNR